VRWLDTAFDGAAGRAAPNPPPYGLASLHKLRRTPDLDAQFRSDTDTLADAMDPSTESFETIEVRPSKSNINVRLVSLVWLPFTRDAAGRVKPAY